jgi:hypothetical protein
MERKMSLKRVLTFSGILAALITAVLSEMGQDAWTAAKNYFNARVEIRLKDPSAGTGNSSVDSIDWTSDPKHGYSYSYPDKSKRPDGTIAPSSITYPSAKKKPGGSDVIGGTSTYPPAKP